MKRHLLLVLAAVSLLAAVLTGSPLSPVEATTNPTADIGMPFSGKWAYNILAPLPGPWANNNTYAHPAIHNSGTSLWQVDVYANAGTDVFLNVENASGVLSFDWVPATGSCGGSAKIKVKVDTVEIATVYFTHLDNAVASGPITNHMKIGQVSGSCNAGYRHVHMGISSSVGTCYIDHGRPGIDLASNAIIGWLGLGSTSSKMACDTTPPPPPPPADRDGDGVLDDDDDCDAVVGPASNNGCPLEDREVFRSAGDFTGDNRDDVLVVSRASNGGPYIHVLSSTGSSFSMANTLWASPNPAHWQADHLRWTVTDQDGDGDSDLIAFSRNLNNNSVNVLLFRSTGTTFEAPILLGTLPAPWWQWDRLQFVGGNYDTDAAGEIMAVSKHSNDQIAVYVINAESGIPLSPWASPNQFWLWPNLEFGSGDFTGDGKDDVLAVSEGSSGGPYIHVLSSTGSSFSMANTLWASPNPAHWQVDHLRWTVANQDGDQYDDLIAFSHNLNDHSVNVLLFRSTGSTFEPPVLLGTLPAPAWQWGSLQFLGGDYDNDVGGEIMAVSRFWNDQIIIYSIEAETGVPHTEWANPNQFWLWSSLDFVGAS